MERLATLGIRFNQFNAMSVCSPTRRSIMTGQNAARHGTTNWIHAQTNNKGKFGPPDWNWNGLRASDVTLPALLRKGGYRTIHVGKAHFSSEGIDGADPTRIGFDVNIGGGTMGQPGSYYGKENFSGKGPQRARLAVPGLQKYHGQEIFLTEALTREADVRDRSRGEGRNPVFPLLRPICGPLPVPVRSALRRSLQELRQEAPSPGLRHPDRGHGQVARRSVWTISNASSIADNTLILFLGDNGSDAPLGEAEEVGSSAPLRGKKGSCYEGGVRVPFIAAWAKANPQQARAETPAHRRRCHPVPTRLGRGFVPDPTRPNNDQHSRRASGGRQETPHPAERKVRPGPPAGTFLMHYPHEHRSSYWSSLRDGEWKVIHRYHPETGTPVRELYHLKARSLRTEEPRRHPSRRTQADDAKTHRLAGTTPGSLPRRQGRRHRAEAAALNPDSEVPSSDSGKETTEGTEDSNKGSGDTKGCATQGPL